MRTAPDALLVAWLDRQNAESVWIPSITLFEARLGLAPLPKGRRRQALETSFARLLQEDLQNRLPDFDSVAAAEAALLAAARPRTGKPVDMRDTQIAGIAPARRANFEVRSCFLRADSPVKSACVCWETDWQRKYPHNPSTRQLRKGKIMALLGAVSAGAPERANAGNPALAVMRAGTAAARHLFLTQSTAAGTDGSTGKMAVWRNAKPYIAAMAVILTSCMLVVAIFFTLVDLQWIAFLAGVLFSSILAMSARSARIEITSAARAESLTLAEYRLGKETRQRVELEGLLAVANARLVYCDGSLPVMVAFVDADMCYQYHNPAYARWVGLPDDKIDGRHMRDVLGRKVFGEIEAYALQVAKGSTVRYERTHWSPTGTVFRLAVQSLPVFAHDGTYTGFYLFKTDITERADLVRAPGAFTAPGTGNAILPEPASEPGSAEVAVAAEWQEATNRLLAAINGNEFTLFCHLIKPLNAPENGPCHYEILIRLKEEESGLVPPGAFFPLAEEHGLLPQLDRWVIKNVLEWILTPEGDEKVKKGAIFFINISAATLSDPNFPDFVENQLRHSGVSPRALCLEVAESDLIAHQGDAVAFARNIRPSGCLIAISGVGFNRISAEILKLFTVNFFKIDGAIVRRLLSFPVYLGQAVAISKLARALGARTVAEMVEDPATIELLRTIKVDFVQGFCVSRPQLLTELKPPTALSVLSVSA